MERKSVLEPWRPRFLGSKVSMGLGPLLANGQRSNQETTEHVGEMVEVSHNLTKGLEFEPWECNYVIW